MRTKLHKDWFRRLKVNRWDAWAHTHTNGQQCDLMSLLCFFQNKDRLIKD
jgi:hypothetical protein